MPRLMGEPVSLNTSRGRAKKVKELPRLEMVWPSQKRPKSSDNSQLRRPLVPAVIAAFWPAGPTAARPLQAAGTHDPAVLIHLGQLRPAVRMPWRRRPAEMALGVRVDQFQTLSRRSTSAGEDDRGPEVRRIGYGMGI